MRVEQLEYFKVTADTKSITLASKALHLTPQALSMALKALETELNITLLNKTYSSVTLTEDGAYAYALTKEILERVDKLRARQNQHSAETEHCLAETLNVYTTPLINSVFIMPTIYQFMENYPSVQPVLKELSPNSFFNLLEELNFDLSILQLPQERLIQFQSKYENSFIFEPFMQGNLSVICNKAHPLANKRTVSWNMLKEYPLIMLDEHNLEDFSLTEYIEKYGQPKATIIFSNINLCLNKILLDHNVIALSVPNTLKFIIDLGKENLSAIPLRETIKIITVAIYPRDKALSKSTQLYLNMLREFIKN